MLRQMHLYYANIVSIGIYATSIVFNNVLVIEQWTIKRAIYRCVRTKYRKVYRRQEKRRRHCLYVQIFTLILHGIKWSVERSPIVRFLYYAYDVPLFSTGVSHRWLKVSRLFCLVLNMEFFDRDLWRIMMSMIRVENVSSKFHKIHFKGILNCWYEKGSIKSQVRTMKLFHFACHYVL